MDDPVAAREARQRDNHCDDRYPKDHRENTKARQVRNQNAEGRDHDEKQYANRAFGHIFLRELDAVGDPGKEGRHQKDEQHVLHFFHEFADFHFSFPLSCSLVFVAMEGDQSLALGFADPLSPVKNS